MYIENIQFYRKDYEILNKYEYLTHPLSASISGAIRFYAVGG